MSDSDFIVGSIITATSLVAGYLLISRAMKSSEEAKESFLSMGYSQKFLMKKQNVEQNISSIKISKPMADTNKASGEPIIKASKHQKTVELESTFLVINPGVITTQKQLNAFIERVKFYGKYLPMEQTSIIKNYENLELDFTRLEP